MLRPLALAHLGQRQPAGLAPAADLAPDREPMRLGPSVFLQPTYLTSGKLVS